MFDYVVNPLHERFPPSGSFTKVLTSPEPLLICALEADDNEKVDDGGREDPEAGVRQRRMNKSMLLHFNQLLPSLMAAEHPEGRRRHES